MDAGIIDGMVNGAGERARNLGSLLRLMQSGNIRSYATWVLLGSVAVIAVVVGIAGGGHSDELACLNPDAFRPDRAAHRLSGRAGNPSPVATEQPAMGACRVPDHLRGLADAGGRVRPQPGWEQVLNFDLPWIASPDIHFAISVNGVSLWLINAVTAFLTPLCVLVSWRSIQNRAKEFYAFLLLLEFGLIGVFLAQDLFLFYVFWEVSLVPMYFLIGIWGHDRRIYAAVKFFLYTFTGSVLMLAAIIYLYNQAHTFSYSSILEQIASSKLSFTSGEQMLLFLAFFVAFAIKVPLFPLHTWLPDAHVEAPTAGSIMLASVMLKMGTYGIFHFCLPMFPAAARSCAPWIAVLAIIGIIYGALVAMVQPNMKKLVAYSSVSHLGFVVLGIFSFTPDGSGWRDLPNAQPRNFHRRAVRDRRAAV